MGVSLIYQTGQVVPEKLVKMKPYDEFQEMDIFDPCDPYGQYEGLKDIQELYGVSGIED